MGEVSYGWRGYCRQLVLYESSQQVNIKNRFLGYIYWTCFATIMLYILIYVFIVSKQYLDEEKAEGIVYPKLLGSAVSEENSTYYWDLAEEVPWGEEGNSVFVPAKVVITRRQVQGSCANPQLYCESDDDCTSNDLPNVVETEECGDTLEGSKGCMSWGWCPPENSYNSTTYYLEGASKQIMWLRYQLLFRQIIDTEVGTLDDSSFDMFPGEGSDAYEVNDLLLQGGTNFSDIVETGAVFQVKTVVLCVMNPEEQCDTHVEVKRLDDLDGNGFALSYANYYRVNGTLYRDLRRMIGVRFLLSCSGIYKAPSFQKIVLQLASAIGLLIAASAVTDAIMLYLLSEKQHYRKLKILEVETNPSEEVYTPLRDDDEPLSRPL